MNVSDQELKDWLGSGSINVFGMPFAGKDTQARRLSERLDAEIVGGGDILRHYPDQARLQQLMATGELIPSDTFEEIVTPFFFRDELKGRPLILSSVGRSHGEEPVIMKVAAAAEHPVRLVVMLRLEEPEVWRRFEAAKLEHDRGKRTDDSPEALTTRLEEFAHKTQPAIEYYRKQGILLEVDGSRSRDEVEQAIVVAIGERVARRD